MAPLHHTPTHCQYHSTTKLLLSLTLNTIVIHLIMYNTVHCHLLSAAHPTHIAHVNFLLASAAPNQLAAATHHVITSSRQCVHHTLFIHITPHHSAAPHHHTHIHRTCPPTHTCHQSHATCGPCNNSHCNSNLLPHFSSTLSDCQLLYAPL